MVSMFPVLQPFQEPAITIDWAKDGQNQDTMACRKNIYMVPGSW